jgi:hypothetical protein
MGGRGLGQFGSAEEKVTGSLNKAVNLRIPYNDGNFLEELRNYWLAKDSASCS